jgi:hypothetical protein
MSLVTHTINADPLVMMEFHLYLYQTNSYTVPAYYIVASSRGAALSKDSLVMSS